MKLRFRVPHQIVLCALLCLLFVPIGLRAATPAVPSSPPDRVVDLANIIEPALEAQLVAALRELEEKTTAQMAVLTVSSLDGETVEAFSLRTAEQWKLGQKGKDNGLLLTVALKERKYRFETGYGLEGALPDSLLGSIGREKMVPFFKEGKYGEGIAAATKEVLAVLAKQHNVQLGSGIQVLQHRPKIPLASIKPDYSEEEKYIKIFLGGLLLFFIIMLFFTKKDSVEKEIFLKKYGSSSRRSGSSWSSSDSSSSSSSSSDFSGGGGDFGGGGSSGDW